MGLDWRSQIIATRRYKEDYVRKYYAEELEQGVDLEELIREEAPKTMKPCSIVGAKKMTEEEYEKAFHWREKNLREAIHWLRTLEKYGVDMGISY
jgi:hypothetical protein